VIDPQTLDRIRPVVRRLRETKPSIAEILHVRIDAAIKLIEEQAEEITRLKAETRHQAASNNSARGNLIAVSVLIDNRRQPIYRRRYDGQPFVAGLWGSSFVLEVRNLHHGRIETISSVDGRNTLKDEPADAHHNRGMIISGHGTWTITGWRIDDNNTAEFVFTEPSASLEPMATGGNVNAGVFGFAVYKEREIYSTRISYTSNHTYDLYAGERPKSLSRSADMGTGIGDIRHDSVGHTTFNRADSTPEIITIQYRSREWLERNGIIAPDEPNAFPGIGTGYQQYIK